MKCKITCVECGGVFSSPREARLHEKNCPPDSVVFSKVFPQKKLKASRGEKGVARKSETLTDRGRGSARMSDERGDNSRISPAPRNPESFQEIAKQAVDSFVEKNPKLMKALGEKKKVKK